MKDKYLLVVKSITYAQRILNILKNSGIPVSLSRTPRVLNQKSCSYTLIISHSYLEHTKKALLGKPLPSIRLYGYANKEYTFLGEFL